MVIDITRYLGAVRREVVTREHEGQPANVVVATRDYDTTLDDLWDALTNPERIPRWFLPVSGDFRVGGHYALKGNASGTITACEPPSRLALTWEFGGQVTWVTVALTSNAGGTTTLRLEHTAPAGGDMWDQYGPGAVGIGWELGLMGLAMHLGSRAAVDPAAFEAWSASADGKAFMRGSGDGWCAAAIAAGLDPQHAREAARRTRAFYTGEDGPGEGD